MIVRSISGRREIGHGRVPTKFISKIKGVGKRVYDKMSNGHCFD
jgi:hypothetical protein